jgi:hypothetical protein
VDATASTNLAYRDAVFGYLGADAVTVQRGPGFARAARAATISLVDEIAWGRTGAVARGGR